MKKTSSYPYAGTPGQGHPDELRINRIFANKSWQELSKEEINCSYDDIPLIRIEDFAIILPAWFEAVFSSNCCCRKWEIHESLGFKFDVSRGQSIEQLRLRDCIKQSHPGEMKVQIFDYIVRVLFEGSFEFEGGQIIANIAFWSRILV